MWDSLGHIARAAALHIAPAARELHVGVACDPCFPRSDQELSGSARQRAKRLLRDLSFWVIRGFRSPNRLAEVQGGADSPAAHVDGGSG